MSWRATSWASEQVTGSAITKGVLWKLADNANDEGVCWPSIPIIARHCELGERTVQEHLRRLEDLQLIWVERRVNGKVNLPNVYHLRMPGTVERDGGVVRGAHHGGGAPAAPVVQETEGVVRHGAPGGAATRTTITSNEPSENLHSLVRETDAELRAKVWPACQQWPGLPSTATETKTLAALDRLSDPPPLCDLLDCIEAHQHALEAENLRRGSAGAAICTAPHNWLIRDRGWEKYLTEVRARPARIAENVERGARVMATLGADVHARLRRARLNEGEISALDGVEFEAGDPPTFRCETLQQEQILRKHQPDLNEIWIGVRIERGPKKETA